MSLFLGQRGEVLKKGELRGELRFFFFLNSTTPVSTGQGIDSFPVGWLEADEPAEGSEHWALAEPRDKRSLGL